MNKTYVFFNKQTGIIRQVTSMPEAMRELNTQEGESSLEVPVGVVVDPDKHRIGEGGNVLPYSPPVDSQKLWRQFRAERGRRLTASDWTMAPDAPTDKQKWGAYRQALRDLPETVEDISNVQWPDIPT